MLSCLRIIAAGMEPVNIYVPLFMSDRIAAIVGGLRIGQGQG